jgi:hypothetical protein
VDQFLGKLQNWAKAQSEDPGQWAFGSLKRQGDGSFQDRDLVNLLRLGAENVAGITIV